MNSKKDKLKHETPHFGNTLCLLHNVNQIYLKRVDCILNRIYIVINS